MSYSFFIAQAAAGTAPGAFDVAFTFFDRGGPVMWPLLACSLIGLTVTFERLFVFWRYSMANFYFRNHQQELVDLAREGRFDEALTMAKQADSPICRVCAQALEHREVGFQETLEITAQCEMDRLRRGLSVLDTMITVSPMLGILGTVTGIITTFNLLGDTGMENPLGATAGIAEALITTVAGLIVAISCLFPFNYFVSQLKRRTLELEQAAHHLELAYKSGLARAAETPPAASGGE
jgi:biopolymer transport protein ExbB